MEMHQIIEKLLEDLYMTSHGYPDSEEHVTEFINKILSKISELRAIISKQDDIEYLILETVQKVKEQFCKQIDEEEVLGVTGEYLESVELYECEVEKIGKFYIVWHEKIVGSLADEGFIAFTVTRSLERARKEYEEVAEEIREKREQIEK